MVVDLPAPFGPRNPKNCPVATLKVTSSTAVNSPKRRVRLCVSIAGEVMCRQEYQRTRSREKGKPCNAAKSVPISVLWCSLPAGWLAPSRPVALPTVPPAAQFHPQETRGYRPPAHRAPSMPRPASHTPVPSASAMRVASPPFQPLWSPQKEGAIINIPTGLYVLKNSPWRLADLRLYANFAIT